MQYQIETVDPKLLDLRHFPLPSSRQLFTAQDEASKLQGGGQDLKGDDIDLSLHSKSIYARRRSSIDQLDILGQFEFSFSSAQEPNLQEHICEQEIPAYSPTTPDGFSNSLTYAAPWSHLHAFQLSAIQRNQRHLRGLEIIPAGSTNSTPRTSPRETSSSGSNPTYRDCETSQATQSVHRASATEPLDGPGDGLNSSISPTSGTHVWPNPSSPDSGVAIVSGDTPTESRHADHTLLYGFNALEAVHHLTDAAKTRFPFVETKFSPFQGACQPMQASDYQLKDRLRTSNDETLDYDMESVSQYPFDESFTNQEYGKTGQYHTALERETGLHIETYKEGTCQGFRSDVSASYPPSTGCFLECWPCNGNPRNPYGLKSTSSPFPLRPATRNSKGNRKASVGASELPLAVIHEHGKGEVTSTVQNTRKGRRAGPLSKAKATQAAIIRKNRSVCIRCKMMKQSCSGEVPCVGCRENIGAKIWKSPCIKADFIDIVEAGSCNYISQRRINHFTLDQSRRVTMLLPETFDLTELLDLLKPRLSRFNIHARQLSGSLYTLDLAKCFDFLTEIHNVQESGVFELHDFIDNKLLKVQDWLKCVTEPCSITESLALLAKWNNMPSRASYDIVSLVEGVPDRPIDVEDPEDKKEILIAAQLSRIICRALEVAAFRFLQKELNNLAKKSNEDGEKFVLELGQILLTLRWRISWWRVLGDGSKVKVRDESRDRYIDRVTSLTRVLYFYYCNAKKKLPSWTNPRSLKGVRSIYADTELAVFDDFPHHDSIDGFDEWMSHGQELIYQAGVQQRLSRY